MAIAAGAYIDRCEALSPLSEVGKGEAFRARNMRLDREVGFLWVTGDGQRFLINMLWRRSRTRRVEEKNPQTGQLTMKTSPAKRPITIRDLQRRTAGLTYQSIAD